MVDPLSGFPVTIEIPIQWGDQDAFRHVNNTVYIRWFESSRVAYTRKAGLWDFLETDRIGPILASTHCEYRTSLTYPDTVQIGAQRRSDRPDQPDNGAPGCRSGLERGRGRGYGCPRPLRLQQAGCLSDTRSDPSGDRRDGRTSRLIVTTRWDQLDRIREQGQWDLLVIGGGATGLGTAVDAASRGYSTLLLEADDFARGTSSRSTKLIHGGVRYLAQGNIGLVREALNEREILLRNAPHLVHRLDFLVPAYSLADVAYYGLGLKAYDLLAFGSSLGGSRPVGRREALRLAPTLAPTRLHGGVVYADGQFDDARLAIALVRTLLGLGGVALNGLSVVGIVKEGTRIEGVDAVDGETGESFRILAKAIVNATGVGADAIRLLDNPGSEPSMAPSRGSHVVLDRSFLPGESAVLIPKTDDGRVLFAIPWRGKVLLGTTDMPVESTTREPRPSAVEIRYLLDHAGRYFARKPRVEDIRSTFAGLRPLLGKGGTGRTASLSREHAVFVSGSGLVTITGGKWTTYRRMGMDAVNHAVEVAGLASGISKTESLQLHGWTPEPFEGPFATYGSDAGELKKLIQEQPEWGEPIHPRLPDLKVEVIWAARHELARTVEDVLARRTRGLFLDARASVEASPVVASLLAGELGFDQGWEAAQREAFGTLANSYLPIL